MSRPIFQTHLNERRGGGERQKQINADRSHVRHEQRALRPAIGGWRECGTDPAETVGTSAAIELQATFVALKTACRGREERVSSIQARGSCPWLQARVLHLTVIFISGTVYIQFPSSDLPAPAAFCAPPRMALLAVAYRAEAEQLIGQCPPSLPQETQKRE